MAPPSETGERPNFQSQTLLCREFLDQTGWLQNVINECNRPHEKQSPNFPKRDPREKLLSRAGNQTDDGRGDFRGIFLGGRFDVGGAKTSVEVNSVGVKGVGPTGSVELNFDVIKSVVDSRPKAPSSSPPSTSQTSSNDKKDETAKETTPDTTSTDGTDPGGEDPDTPASQCLEDECHEKGTRVNVECIEAIQGGGRIDFLNGRGPPANLGPKGATPDPGPEGDISSSTCSNDSTTVEVKDCEKERNRLDEPGDSCEEGDSAMLIARTVDGIIARIRFPIDPLFFSGAF